MGASSCADLGTPEGVLQFANNAVQADDPKLLRTVLADEAASMLETYEGYAAFRYQLYKQDVVLGKPANTYYVSTLEKDVSTHKADVLSKSAGEVMYHHAFTVTVRCTRWKDRVPVGDKADKCLIIGIEYAPDLVVPSRYVEYGGR